MNNLIEERNERTRKRKNIKRKMDKIIGLSGGRIVDTDTGEIMNTLKMSTNISMLSDTTIRLLDEGYFDNGFVIKKGTLEKYLNGQNQYVRGYELTDDGWQTTDVLNLTDDFRGTVNLGHMEFATFPYIIGEWDKKDLTLVDTENERKGLDVNVRLDEDSIFVQELKRQPFDIGISSEFYYHVNEEDTETLSEMLDMYMPVIDEVFIFAYGLVGECGNVNSSGLELKGVAMANDSVNIKLNLENAEEVKEQIEEIKEKLDEVNEEVKELGVEEIDITVNEEEELKAEEEKVEEETETEEEKVELSADDADEESDEEEVEEEDSDDEDEIEEDGEDAVDEDEVEEADEALSEALALIKALKAENAGLKDIIAELKKSNRKNAKKLAAEKEAKAKFLEATKNLSIELLPNEKEAEQMKADEEARLEAEKQYKYGDGIADI